MLLLSVAFSCLWIRNRMKTANDMKRLVCLFEGIPGLCSFPQGGRRSHSSFIVLVLIYALEDKTCFARFSWRRPAVVSDICQLSDLNVTWCCTAQGTIPASTKRYKALRYVCAGAESPQRLNSLGIDHSCKRCRGGLVMILKVNMWLSPLELEKWFKSVLSRAKKTHLLLLMGHVIPSSQKIMQRNTSLVQITHLIVQQNGFLCLIFQRRLNVLQWVWCMNIHWRKI